MDSTLRPASSSEAPSSRDLRYAFVHTLGRGGMADVYLVSARGPGDFTKLLVVKELRPEFANDEEFVRMFLAEARLAARLQHPDVVQTYDVLRSGSRFLLTMEYLEGQSLHRALLRLDHTDPIVRRFYLQALVGALSGLHYAHELHDYDGTPLGIVHRDVSPHNVFVLYSGHVKLVDFGVAKMAGATGETRSGVVKGKASYMAPEQAMSRPTDRRADVYACGVMLWEALSGRRMWAGLDDVSILGRLLNGETPPLELVATDIPDSLRSVCERALARNPEDRYATADEMRTALVASIGQENWSLGVDEVGRLCSALFEKERRELGHKIHEHVSGASRRRRFANLSELSLARDDLITQFEVPNATGSNDVTRAHTRSGVPLRQRKETVRLRAGMGLALLTLAGGIAGVVLVTRGHDEPERVPKAERASLPEAPQGPPGCTSTNKPVVDLSGEIESDATLSCSKDYRLKFNVFVVPGTTLTIEPGTTIFGDGATQAALVVQPGGRIVAEGTSEHPIVFTSSRPPDQRKPGDWGGVVLLGRAPVNLVDEHGRRKRGQVEGITFGGEFGGNDPDDDSGVLRYVRIEYSGTEIGPANELNGLTMAGVGNRTRVDHVQVLKASDDCFEFFGGTVDAKHLVCHSSGDDGFDWDFGYRGRLQFLVLHSDRSSQPAGMGFESDNGFEGDNDPNGSDNEPRSAPVIYNATLCGPADNDAKPSYGMLLRRGTHATIRNSIVSGFHAGWDLRDRGTRVSLESSIFTGNVVHDVAYPERGDGAGLSADDDFGLDEVALFAAFSTNRSEQPAGFDCSTGTPPQLGPTVALTENANQPPEDGFFDPAAYVGAVRDSNDGWYREPWTRWSDR